MKTSYSPADIIAAQTNKPNLTIGSFTFWDNPFEFRVKEERIEYDVPTKDGVVRFSYGVQKRAYTISGYFGNSGLDGLNAAGSFRPTFDKQHRDRPFSLSFPMFGIRRVTIYIDSFEYWVEQDDEHYIRYQILASEYPPTHAAVSAITLGGSALPAAVGQIGNAPP